MESSLSQSVQALVRPGKTVDLYYPDPALAEKAAFRTSVNTRFVQDFQTLSGGTSTFVIPPSNGIQDCILQFTLPTPGAAGWASNDSSGLGVCRGWGYGLIKSISWRYGGSSQYFLTGQQVLQAALSMATDSGSRDAILSLGGNAVRNDGTTDEFATPQHAYVWLPLPHSMPSAEGKQILPTDLMTQQVTVTVELHDLKKIFSIAGDGAVANLPTALASAKFQCQQVMLENQGDALARRVDMTTHALTLPIQFRQQEVAIQLGNGATLAAGAPIVTTVTGFRSGEVKELHCWLTADSANTPNPAVNAAQKPLRWYGLQDASMTYAGEVFARYDANSGALWNLVNGKIPAFVNDVDPSASGSTVSFSAASSTWTVLPFSQPIDISETDVYVNGKAITNGVVGLSFKIPDGAPSSTYTLHVSIVYNAALVLSQGSCEYIL